MEDDGSLKFLNIPRDTESRSFNCDTTTQSKLINTTFWVVDFLEDVPTRFSKQKGGKGQTLVEIKTNKDSPQSCMQKFFTGSTDILYILQQIKELSFTEYKKCVSSWLGWAKYSNSKNLLSKIIKNEYYESVL